MIWLAQLPDYEQIARLVKPGGRPRSQNMRDGQCSSTCADVPGDCCLTICPSGRQCITTFGVKADGTWEKIHDYLRAEVRVRAGRQVEPSAGIADTQSVKLLGKIRNTQLSNRD